MRLRDCFQCITFFRGNVDIKQAAWSRFAIAYSEFDFIVFLLIILLCLCIFFILYCCVFFVLVLPYGVIKHDDCDSLLICTLMSCSYLLTYYLPNAGNPPTAFTDLWNVFFLIFVLIISGEGYMLSEYCLSVRLSVILSVCLSVCRITTKVISRFH